MNRKKRRNPVYAHSLKECTEFLAMLVKAKEEELNNLNTQLANQRKQLNSYLIVIFIDFKKLLLTL